MPVSTRRRRRRDNQWMTMTTTCDDESSSIYFESNNSVTAATTTTTTTTKKRSRRLLTTTTTLDNKTASSMEEESSVGDDYEAEDNDKNAVPSATNATATSVVSSKYKSVSSKEVVDKSKSGSTSSSNGRKKPRNNNNNRSVSSRTPQTTKTTTTTSSLSASSTRTRAPPKDWEVIYELVEELRQDRTAPVDTDGGEALPETKYGPSTFRFQVLIALMLSSQTKDAIVGETMRALQQYGLTVQRIHDTSPQDLDVLIGRVGFHNNKTRYIKQTVEILLTDYDGDIPPTAELLMELPGVGPKMAYIVESVAWGQCSGIGVDTHMHRMFNALQWVCSNNPEQTRKQLEAWLPRNHWPTVNKLWVGFGQEVQQQKPKIIRKALDCSRPADALRLLKRLGVDINKEGQKMGMESEIREAIRG